ncbi:MAG TPA: hypothetical protein VMT71_08645 [Syntrophorhabdales bacterium]|nr:hypothetical protein [Syntrophorhabdales bacterium]
MDMPLDYPVLTIEIQNIQPIELTDLTNSLLSFADEYKRFINQQDTPQTDLPQEIKLYIKEIRSGSIVADLVAFAPGMIPFLEHSKSVIEYARYIKVICDYLLGKVSEKPMLHKKDYENISNFLEPIAKDSASQLNCHTTINGNVTVLLTLSSLEANATQNRANKEISLLREPSTGIREKVLLYWYQARNDPKSNGGDKAIIESIQQSRKGCF